MNQRTISIVTTLLEKKESNKIKDLAARFEVSERTIRNDLNEINGLLAEAGIDALSLERGGVIRIPMDMEKLLPTLSTQDYYSYKLSRQERIQLACALILTNVGYITLSTIANNMFVSRATIINDLPDIKATVAEHGLDVVSQPNKGLLITGPESKKRLFIAELQSIRFEENAGQGAFVVSTLQPGDIITIRKIINEQLDLHNYKMKDASFLKLQKYLAIMIDRNKMGEFIEPQEPVNSTLGEVAFNLLRCLCQYITFQTSEDEVKYLCRFMEENCYLEKKDFDVDTIRIQLLTRKFIRCLSEELSINLNNDYDFYENLATHMRSMYYSDESLFPDNPILREIVERDPSVMEAITNHLDVFREFDKREITDNERLYMGVHLCAALERKKNAEVSFHVVVACHAGIGTSQLLLQRIKQHFNFKIVDIISAHEAVNLTEDIADLVIATVPLEDCKIPYVVVNPLMSDEDYIRVSNKIDELRSSRNLTQREEEKDVTLTGVMERVASVLNNWVPDMAEDLAREIRRDLRPYFNQSEQQDSSDDLLAPMLHQLLNCGHIQLDVDCTDWEDAVRKSAAPMLRDGYIEARYVDAMVENIKENGPYIVISPGFAVPHEGLEAGSNRVGMNLIRLKTPVAFGAEELDPVEFVCCLSAVDHKTHLKAFFNLVNMLSNEQFHRELHEAATVEDMAQIIEKFEYQL